MHFTADVQSLITFNLCHQEHCVNESIQYQCIVSDEGTLRWRIRNGTATLATISYTDGDAVRVGFSTINGASQFSTDLSSATPLLISNISFTVQSSISGYTIVCEDGTDNKSCPINIRGIYMCIY